MAWQAQRRGYKAPMDFNLLIQRKREHFADLEGNGEESNMRCVGSDSASKRRRILTRSTIAANELEASSVHLPPQRSP
jgi:hypothetical protein